MRRRFCNLLRKIMIEPRRNFKWLFVSIGNGRVMVEWQRTSRAIKKELQFLNI